ncbi:MAG: Tll0287-like domain-containing protein [Planctomycetota bacterium]|jgi:hypothetical protein
MRRTLFLPFLGFLSFLGLIACGGEDDAKQEAEVRVLRSQQEAHAAAMQATGDLLGVLVKRLTDELRVKEPHEALEICSAEAQGITQKIREKHDLSIRRTALRYRNPKNAPDAYERAWMEKELEKKAANPAGESEVVTAPDGSRELRYIRPLHLAQLCTECHGPKEGLSPQVIAALKERYPDDRATGFVPGDLRGIVSVRVPVK